MGNGRRRAGRARAARKSFVVLACCVRRSQTTYASSTGWSGHCRPIGPLAVPLPRTYQIVSLCRSEGAQSMRGSIADSVQALHKRTAGTALAGTAFFLHLKNRGPGRLGCGPPRLLRPHRDTVQGQRAADVRRYGVESSRCTPSVIGKSVCHVKTTVRRTRLQAAGCSPLGPGDNGQRGARAVFPRPGQTGPLPRRKAPGIPSKIQLV